MPTSNLMRTSRGIKSFWFGIVGAPILWAMHLQLTYSLVGWVNKTQHYTILHVVTAIFFVLALVCAVVSWRDFTNAGTGSPDTSEGGERARMRFFGALGAMTAVLFAIVILATGATAFFFNASWV